MISAKDELDLENNPTFKRAIQSSLKLGEAEVVVPPPPYFFAFLYSSCAPMTELLFPNVEDD